MSVGEVTGRLRLDLRPDLRRAPAVALTTEPWLRSLVDVGVERGPDLLTRDVHLPRAGAREASVLDRPESLAAHQARLGPRPTVTAGLVEVLERAGLTGHGGAHVPTAVRWRSALRATGPLTVVANGAESEPLSAKDATLLRQRPHLVLDGLALAAEALGAVRAVLWLHAGDAGARAAVETALAERFRPSDLGLEVLVGPDHYLSGESSAISRGVAGGPALPSVRRPPGQGSARTLVQNVETLARVALLARGLPATPTVLLTVLTDTDRQVVEIPVGTPLVEVLNVVGERAGTRGLGGAPAVLLGGFGGQWVSASVLRRSTIGQDGLRAAGLSLGAGVVAPLPSGACGLRESARIAAYLARMSARQCGPCLFGLPDLAEGLRLLADGTARAGDLRRVVEDLGSVAGRGACNHPDGAVRMIASALETFAEDVAEHKAGRPCAGSRRAVLPVPFAAP